MLWFNGSCTECCNLVPFSALWSIVTWTWKPRTSLTEVTVAANLYGTPIKLHTLYNANKLLLYSYRLYFSWVGGNALQQAQPIVNKIPQPSCQQERSWWEVHSDYMGCMYMHVKLLIPTSTFLHHFVPLHCSVTLVVRSMHVTNKINGNISH